MARKLTSLSRDCKPATFLSSSISASIDAYKSISIKQQHFSEPVHFIYLYTNALTLSIKFTHLTLIIFCYIILLEKNNEPFHMVLGGHMPKELFYKLAEEKKKRIQGAALAEFITYKEDYEKASVKRIAQNAGIAIGSIYKYFENKDDLFFYIFEQYRERPLFTSQSSSFHDFSKANLLLGSKLSGTSEILSDILLSNKALYEAFTFNDLIDSEYIRMIQSYISQDKAKGLLRENLDSDIASYLYVALEYVAYKYCEIHKIDLDESQTVIDNIYDIFFQGIYREKEE